DIHSGVECATRKHVRLSSTRLFMGNCFDRNWNPGLFQDASEGGAMNQFGVGNAYGNLARVLMHRPGLELNRVHQGNLKEFHFARPVDREKFLTEYDQMISLFKEHGTEVLFLTD